MGKSIKVSWEIPGISYPHEADNGFGMMDALITHLRGGAVSLMTIRPTELDAKCPYHHESSSVSLSGHHKAS
jgi:hypothetical protein